MLDRTTQQRTFNQIINLFVLPEIRERQKKGIISRPFNIFAAQIIFRKNEKPKIRLNDEVKIQFTARVKKGTLLKKGALVNINQIEDVENIRLIPENGNEAHISLLRIKNQWKFTFDFRYDKRRAIEIVKSAKQFFESAEDDLQQKRWRPFIENLFLVVELLSKAELILLPYYKDAKTHKYWRGEYNRWFSLGNTEFQYKDLLNELSNLRDIARYSETRFTIEHNRAKKFIHVAKSMFERLNNYVNS